MSNKEKPSTFLFDKKSSDYYKNQSLNNCKSRNRCINRLYNSLVNCKTIVSQMIQLENNKDYYVPFDTIVNYFMETFESLIDKTSEYKNNLDLEMQDLLSRDFEKITEENVSKIRAKENEENCTEIYK